MQSTWRSFPSETNIQEAKNIDFITALVLLFNLPLTIAFSPSFSCWWQEYKVSESDCKIEVPIAARQKRWVPGWPMPGTIPRRQGSCRGLMGSCCPWPSRNSTSPLLKSRVILSLSKGIHSQTPSRRLELWIVPNPRHAIYFFSVHHTMMKF